MKTFFVVFVLFWMMSCQEASEMNNRINTSGTSWQLVFKNDRNGDPVFGDKATLLDAARNGTPIRVGWGGKLRRDSTKTLEHYGEGVFLTILNEEDLFVQLPQIVGQQPFFDPDSLKIRFRETNKWTRMVGTNGYALGLMIDIKNDSVLSNGLDRKAETSWYILK